MYKFTMKNDVCKVLGTTYYYIVRSKEYSYYKNHTPLRSCIEIRPRPKYSKAN